MGLTSTFQHIVHSETGPSCFTSIEARGLIRDGDKGGRGRKSEGRPRIPPEEDRRDRGPPPEQWKC